MFFFGELRDKKVSEEIVFELKQIGIAAHSTYSERDDLYYLFVESENDLTRALELFRLRMGFLKSPEIDEEWIKIKKVPRGDATFFILIFCIFIFVVSYMNIGRDLYRLFFIGSPETSFLYEVSRGQIWRLVTPIFLHMGFLHIVFNMLWFKDLGYIIEYSFKKNFLLIFVFVSGIVSNLFQVIVAGPEFGGMSGVLYGMLGFVWVYKKLNQSFEFDIPKFDLRMMIAWYFICLAGLIGPIANTAHGIGLAAGMFFGIFKEMREFTKEHFKYSIYAISFIVITLFVEWIKLHQNGGNFYLLRFIEG